MNCLSVVIPYFQREEGVLSRALRSIHSQRIPEGWEVEVIVVDDGSPLPAVEEVCRVSQTQRVRVLLIEQPNAGPAAARNRGLDAIDSNSTLIAFLDSDDVWPDKHVAKAIDAYEMGYDLCFSDNHRPGWHNSHLRDLCPQTTACLLYQQRENGLVNVPIDTLVRLIIEEFPTQASTVTYRRSIHATLRFQAGLATCGEDVPFFVALAHGAGKACFNEETQVECGGGVNIFYGQLNWDSQSYLTIKQDQVRSHTLIAKIPGLPRNTRSSNRARLHTLRCAFVFHTVRYMARTHGRIPSQVRFLTRTDPMFLWWFPLCFLWILVRYPLGRYKP